MLVLVKKFSVLKDGVTYSKGSVIDVSDDEAAELLKYPKEFEAVKNKEAENDKAEAGGAEEQDVEKMSVAELKKFCRSRNIAINGARTREELLEAIDNAEAEEETGELPGMDEEDA